MLPIQEHELLEISTYSDYGAKLMEVSCINNFNNDSATEEYLGVY